jgi:hypothetical protein
MRRHSNRACGEPGDVRAAKTIRTTPARNPLPAQRFAVASQFSSKRTIENGNVFVKPMTWRGLAG